MLTDFVCISAYFSQKKEQLKKIGYSEWPLPIKNVSKHQALLLCVVLNKGNI